MDGVDGLAILRKAKQELPDSEVVVITGHGDVQTAVEAMKAGAANFLEKPVNLPDLRATVDRVAERLRLLRANKELKRQLEEKFGFEGMVGDMPTNLQAKLLRVLENQEVFRIGSNEPIKVNVRMISASNRDLEAAVASAAFRQDLYFRLKVVTVKLPALRERREDIPLLSL